jgi:hypothetical protein
VPHEADDRRVIDGATLDADGEALFTAVRGIAVAAFVAVFAAVPWVTASVAGGRALALFAGGPAGVAVFAATGRALALFTGTGVGVFGRAVFGTGVFAAVGSSARVTATRLRKTNIEGSEVTRYRTTVMSRWPDQISE